MWKTLFIVFVFSSVANLFLEIKGSREIKKLHKELESIFPDFDFYKDTENMPAHIKRTFLIRDVERLKLCALCHLCRERELQGKKQTIQREQEECRQKHFF